MHIIMPYMQEGATKEDIEQLSKFKFRKLDDAEKFSADLHEPLGGIMTECGTDSPIEHALSQEDAVRMTSLIIYRTFAGILLCYKLEFACSVLKLTTFPAF